MSRLPDLESLSLLVAVAETGSIGAAARNAGMSQPSVSARLVALERALGVGLLTRDTRGSRLTNDGQLVVEWAMEVLNATEKLTRGVEALRRHEESTLRLHASQTVAEYLVPRWLTSLRREHPDISVHMSVGNSTDVIDAVRADACDLGFIESPGVPRDLRSVIVTHDELVLVAAAGTPKRTYDNRSLTTLQLVTRELGSGTRETLERAIGPTDSNLEQPTNSAVKVAVMAGAGYAVLSRLAVHAEVSDGRLVELPVTGVDLRRPIRAVVRRNAPAQPIRDRLVALAGR